ncbi:hypothetical protein PAXINDRAFT_18899 [Paxillus involutus ATCC 200175]|uniref:Uncharacterized protein n=1 Tax=Paxillus involutus ATCC 200175 TaxID=664439 RepID=A0A0C9TA13_PAXIN|nr:hypothetical protein PAXINDRAFT_18899 [Paxillus involutus ATCC 200175]
MLSWTYLPISSVVSFLSRHRSLEELHLSVEKEALYKVSAVLLVGIHLFSLSNVTFHSRFPYLLSPSTRLREAATIWDDVGGVVQDTKRPTEILSRSVTAETNLTFISYMWDDTTLPQHVHRVTALTFAECYWHFDAWPRNARRRRDGHTKLQIYR